MQIIRNETDKSGILIIPALRQYGVTRCNYKNCTNKPNTIGVTNQINVGLCEIHFQELKARQGEDNLQVEFFFNPNPNLDSKIQNLDSKP